MLAHVQGGLFNAAHLARGLAVDGKTVTRYHAISKGVEAIGLAEMAAALLAL